MRNRKRSNTTKQQNDSYYYSVITLRVGGLKSSVKGRDWQIELKNKTPPFVFYKKSTSLAKPDSSLK
jgi:hypothetical protein